MSFDIDRVRAEFPALSIRDGGRPRIYLDNPGGTQVPRMVVQRMSSYLVESNANLGGRFRTSRASDAVVAEDDVARVWNAAGFGGVRPKNELPAAAADEVRDALIRFWDPYQRKEQEAWCHMLVRAPAAEPLGVRGETREYWDRY